MMRRLTDVVLNETITKCNELPNFKVIIFLENEKSYKDLAIRIIESSVREAIYRFPHPNRIEFSNGSIIDFFTPNSLPCHMMRYHEVLYDFAVHHYPPEIIYILNGLQQQYYDRGNL